MKLKLNDKVYDIMKWVVILILPWLEYGYGKLAVVWGLPFAEQIPETINIVAACLGGILAISTAEYNKGLKPNA